MTLVPVIIIIIKMWMCILLQNVLLLLFDQILLLLLEKIYSGPIQIKKNTYYLSNYMKYFISQ